SGFERPSLLEVRDANDEFLFRAYSLKHSTQRLVVDPGVINASVLQFSSQFIDPIRLLVVNVGIKMQHAAFDNLGVVVDIDDQRRVELDGQTVFAVLGALELLSRNRQRLRGYDLVDQIVEFVQLQPDAAVRHEMANITWLERLVNQDSAAANRNLNFAERVARIVGFHALSRHNVVLFNPCAVRRNPFRIEDNLGRAAKTARQRKLFPANADLIRLHFFVALPQRQLKRGNVDGDMNVSVSRLETRLFNVAACEFV